MENNRHPVWNQQFVIPNPQATTAKEGYLYLSLRDRNVQEAPIEELYVPLSQLRPFTPLNLEIVCRNAEYAARPRMFVSITLEMPNRESFIDELCDIIVKMVHFDPLPYASRMFLLMSLNTSKIEEYHSSQVFLGSCSSQ